MYVMDTQVYVCEMPACDMNPEGNTLTQSSFVSNVHKHERCGRGTGSDDVVSILSEAFSHMQSTMSYIMRRRTGHSQVGYNAIL